MKPVRMPFDGTDDHTALPPVQDAGTSVDEILRQNFGERWVTKEFPPMGGNNTALVEDWIRETPDAVAYSSHTMMGPIPRVEDVSVISFMLLRDPVERIKSVYRFERQQQADTWGARLAKEHDFEGYVRARLAEPGDRQCRNFQTHRLASLVPGEGTERERALRALGELTIVGTVGTFGSAIRSMQDFLKTELLEFSVFKPKINVSDSNISTNLSASALLLLKSENSDDVFVMEDMNV